MLDNLESKPWQAIQAVKTRQRSSTLAQGGSFTIFQEVCGWWGGAPLLTQREGGGVGAINGAMEMCVDDGLS